MSAHHKLTSLSGKPDPDESRLGFKQFDAAVQGRNLKETGFVSTSLYQTPGVCGSLKTLWIK